MKMQKHGAILLFLSMLLVSYNDLFPVTDNADDNGTKSIGYELPRFISPDFSDSSTNQSNREFTCGEISEENVKGCCCVTAGLAVFVAMPILLGCLLPTRTLHVQNTTKYPITVSCSGSINSLQKYAHGRLHCSSSINGGNLYGYTPWNSGIKGGYASGHVVNEAGRWSDEFEVSVVPCTHDCSETTQSCSGSGKSRHCSSSTTYYDETVSWTPVIPAATNVTAAVVKRNLRGAWILDNSGYISDVAEKFSDEVTKS